MISRRDFMKFNLNLVVAGGFVSPYIKIARRINRRDSCLLTPREQQDRYYPHFRRFRPPQCP